MDTTINASRELATKHPWIFAGEIERSLLAGLRYLAKESEISPGKGDGIHARANLKDVSKKVLLRQSAARLSYTLFKHYRKLDDLVPEEISTWESYPEVTATLTGRKFIE